jgi:glycerophosphoryl diester phosphodiesterase
MKSTKKINQLLKSKTNKNKPILIAHRGGDGAGILQQNTMTAFEKAVSAGFKYLETDVILSKDAKVVVFHSSSNALLEHWKRYRLQKMTYGQIIKRVNPKPPLLNELFLAFPDTFVSIDAKTNKVVEPLIKLIKDNKAEARVSVASFSLERSTKLSKSLSSKAGLCIHPKLSRIYRLRLSKNLKALKRRGISLIHFPYEYINIGLIEQSHKKNIQVWAYTVNKEKYYRNLSEMGVDGIITDKIHLNSKHKHIVYKTTQKVDKQGRNSLR